MHAIIVPGTIADRLKETVVEAGDFYTFERPDGRKVVSSLWTLPEGKICEILRDGDETIAGSNEQFIGALIDPFYVGIAWFLGCTTLRFGTTNYYNVYGYVADESNCWNQWTPSQVACHDRTGLLFTKSDPAPGLFSYSAVESEHLAVEAIQHFVDTGIINDYLHRVLVRHGPQEAWRYFPV